MEEVWKDINGYEGIYSVSNFGRVKSLKRYRIVSDIIMKLTLCSWGYHIIMLRKDNSFKMHKVHRLVAAAFIPNDENLPQVNHIDGIKTNNNVNNLEWCTQSHNIRHAFRTGLNKMSESGRVRLRIATVLRQLKPMVSIDTITNEVVFYNSVNECAKGLNVVPSAISTCLKRKSLLFKRYKIYTQYALDNGLAVKVHVKESK